MTPDDTFNFHQLLYALEHHDWENRPVCALFGEPETGKSKLAEEFSAQLLQKQEIVTSIDSNRDQTGDEIARRILITTASSGEFSGLRARVMSPGAQVVISNTTIDQSKLRIDLRKRWPRRKALRTDEPLGGGSEYVPFILDEFDQIQRSSWIVFDHVANSSAAVKELLRGLGERLRTGRDLRILLVFNGSSEADLAQTTRELIGVIPTMFHVGNLSAEALEEWANRLGINLSLNNASFVRSLSEGGRAGKAWPMLMSLYLNPAWNARRTERFGAFDD